MKYRAQPFFLEKCFEIQNITLNNKFKYKIYMGDRMKLTELNRGEKAVIVKIGKLGELKKRLTDMGITSGEVIKLERDAPLGDPQQFLVKGTGIAIRKEDANHIEIKDVVETK